jgi:hypothetical protein
MRYMIILLALSLCVAGCAHEKFREKLTEIGDDQKPITTVTQESKWIWWPPYSKSGPMNSNFSYAWGGAENKIVSVQNTSDVDTTTQTEALRAVTSMISDVVAKVISTYLQTYTAPVPATSTDTATAKINTLAELIKQLQAIGLLKGTT